MKAERSITRVAYLATPVEFGGAEQVSLSFLRRAAQETFQICPILFVRPWTKSVFVEKLEQSGIHFSRSRSHLVI